MFYFKSGTGNGLHPSTSSADATKTEIHRLSAIYCITPFYTYHVHYMFRYIYMPPGNISVFLYMLFPYDEVLGTSKHRIG
ncbi:hypothetical protein XELAEV_18039892mg [Xenopus laevis]|uniref:Uncharacterized protein n=1 Tax=Xenopus laevis TaxID=8355 RepID=A0A974C8K2_XENLA|nr:hypothetical protein XELAEV_18039892mg [Xenopus laevis]